jgi:regulator of replication initiation timing
LYIKAFIFYLLLSVLLSLRNSNERPENPLNALNDYFGQYRDPAWDEFDQMKENIEKTHQHNRELEVQIEKLRVDIQREREAKAQRELEAQQRELEAQQKKDVKKPAVKK